MKRFRPNPIRPVGNYLKRHAAHKTLQAQKEKIIELTAWLRQQLPPAQQASLKNAYIQGDVLYVVPDNSMQATALRYAASAALSALRAWPTGEYAGIKRIALVTKS